MPRAPSARSTRYTIWGNEVVAFPPQHVIPARPNGALTLTESSERMVFDRREHVLQALGWRA